MLLSVKTQLTSDNKVFNKLTPKCLSSKLEVFILSESKIGYKVWRIGGLSYDIDVDFEQLEGACLQITGTDTQSFTD